MVIEIGWWAIPAAITAAWLVYGMMPSKAPTGWSSLGDNIVGAFYWLIGLIVVLASWLIWALAAGGKCYDRYCKFSGCFARRN